MNLFPPSLVARLGVSRLWTWLRSHILDRDLTPERIALSFALGACIAFNPVLGVHTGAALVLCLVFRRLHRPLLLAAMMINNPWTTVPIATLSACFGSFLMGRGFSVDLSGIRWESIGWASFASRQGLAGLFGMLEPILAPYLLGGFILSALAVPVGYYLMLTLSRRLRKLHLHLPHLPHLHLPAFHRGQAPKETSHGHAIPDETGPGHAAEAAGDPAEPAGGRDGRR